MHQPLTLIADDNDWKLKSLVETTRRCRPHDRIITASSVREALNIIGLCGETIDTAVFDFDFEFDRGFSGEDLVRAHRLKNRRALIVCATAREAASFEEAEAAVLPAGATIALPFMEANFPTKFCEALAA